MISRKNALCFSCWSILFTASHMLMTMTLSTASTKALKQHKTNEIQRYHKKNANIPSKIAPSTINNHQYLRLGDNINSERQHQHQQWTTADTEALQGRRTSTESQKGKRIMLPQSHDQLDDRLHGMEQNGRGQLLRRRSRSRRLQQNYEHSTIEEGEDSSSNNNESLGGYSENEQDFDNNSDREQDFDNNSGNEQDTNGEEEHEFAAEDVEQGQETTVESENSAYNVTGSDAFGKDESDGDSKSFQNTTTTAVLEENEEDANTEVEPLVDSETTPEMVDVQKNESLDEEEIVSEKEETSLANEEPIDENMDPSGEGISKQTGTSETTEGKGKDNAEPASENDATKQTGDSTSKPEDTKSESAETKPESEEKISETEETEQSSTSGIVSIEDEMTNVNNSENTEKLMIHEERTVRRVGGLGIFLALSAMIFTAWQMSDNPDGIYAAMCRLCITIVGLVLRVLLTPCRGCIGGGFGGSYGGMGGGGVGLRQSYGHVPSATGNGVMDYGYKDPSLELS